MITGHVTLLSYRCSPIDVDMCFVVGSREAGEVEMGNGHGHILRQPGSHARAIIAGEFECFSISDLKGRKKILPK